MGWLSRRRARAGESAMTTRPSNTAVREDRPRSAVPEPVRVASEWSWRGLLIVLGSALVVLGMIHLKTVVVPVLIAVLLASLLAPLTRWLRERLRFPRVLAVVVTLLLLLGVISGLVTLAGRAIAEGLPELTDRAVAGFQDVLDWLSAGPLGLDQDRLDDWMSEVEGQITDNMETILDGALSFTTSAGQIGAGMLIALFCLFFFLLDGRTVWTWLVGLFPRQGRERLDGAGLRSWANLGTYARTQILVAFADGIGIALGAWALGVPLPIPIGILVFLGSFIPIIGALVTGSIAVAVALVDGGILTAVLMLGVVLLVQQLEGNLLQPLLMSRALKLHPVAVLLAVSTGAVLGGIVGALFAVPVIAVANTALTYLNGKETLPESMRAQYDELTRQRWRDA